MNMGSEVTKGDESSPGMVQTLLPFDGVYGNAGVEAKNDCHDGVINKVKRNPFAHQKSIRGMGWEGSNLLTVSLKSWL